MSDINCEYCWGRHDETADCILRYQGQIRELQSQLDQAETDKALDAKLIDNVRGHWEAKCRDLQSQLIEQQQETDKQRRHCHSLADTAESLSRRLDGVAQILYQFGMSEVAPIDALKSIAELCDPPKGRTNPADEAEQETKDG